MEETQLLLVLFHLAGPYPWGAPCLWTAMWTKLKDGKYIQAVISKVMMV